MFTNTSVRTYTKEKVKIFIDAKKGTIETVNRNNPSEEYCYRKLRGAGPVGYPCIVFSKNEEEKTYKEAYYSYLEMHPELSNEEKEDVSKKIRENLNNSVLRALEDYDLVEIGTNGKYGDYIEAMLKPVVQKDGESKRAYEKREKDFRRNELRRAGVSITYILDDGIFNKNTTIIDSMKIKKEAEKYSNYARIENGNRVYGKKNQTLKLSYEY